MLLIKVSKYNNFLDGQKLTLIFKLKTINYGIVEILLGISIKKADIYQSLAGLVKKFNNFRVSKLDNGIFYLCFFVNNNIVQIFSYVLNL